MANDRILSNVEREFMTSALSLGLRTDGRALNAVREMKVLFGSETGTAEVYLGKTRVLARVVHELGPPRPDKPNEGILNINCTFPKYCHESVSHNDIDRICLVIKAGIYESKAIDLESLCVLNGEKVWNLNCDISVIQHDGNIVDCANLAALCALKHHRRPDVTVVGSKITVHSMVDRHPISLSIHHLPICVSLAHVVMNASALDEEQLSKRSKQSIDDGFHTLIDPDLKEEKLMDGRTVYCMTKYNQLCAIDKIGGVPMSAKSFLRFINEFVMSVVRKWSNQIENKFAQFQYKQNDPLQRKRQMTQTVENAIDLFDFESLREKKVETEVDATKNGQDGDAMMVDLDDDEDRMWNEWQQKEISKLQTIQTNLKQSMSEKRVTVDKSILTSDFD